MRKNILVAAIVGLILISPCMAYATEIRPTDNIKTVEEAAIEEETSEENEDHAAGSDIDQTEDSAENTYEEIDESSADLDGYSDPYALGSDEDENLSGSDDVEIEYYDITEEDETEIMKRSAKTSWRIVGIQGIVFVAITVGVIFIVYMLQRAGKLKF